MPMRVLVVDDDDDTLFGLREMLASPEVAVFTAGALVEAEVLLKSSAYDVMIADLMLGSSNPREGLKLVQSVRARFGGTKIIVVTGCGESDIADRAFEAGADLFFAKPVAGRVLRQAAERLYTG